MKGRNIVKPNFVTTMDDQTWKNASLIERAVHVARSQEKIKVRELTENWGGMVTIYLKVAGLFSKAPWCAAFVYWCLLQAGADKKKLWKNPASTYFLWEWAKNSGRLYKSFPASRSIGVFNSRSGFGHTWFYIDKKGTTIEGNTNDNGSREGVGVFQRFRNLSSIAIFPRWGCVKITDDLYEQ